MTIPRPSHINFFTCKNHRLKGYLKFLKYPFRHSTFLMPKPTFYSQYVLVLVAKWLIYAAICGFLYTWRLLILLHVLRSGRMAKWSEAPPRALGDVGCRFKSRRSNSYFFPSCFYPLACFLLSLYARQPAMGHPTYHVKVITLKWEFIRTGELTRTLKRNEKQFELAGNSSCRGKF